MSPKDLTGESETKDRSNDVVEGPDLNSSKPLLDKKLYRQVLLPNGLRAVLVSDSVAMTQSYNAGGIYVDDEDDESGEESEDEKVDVSRSDSDGESTDEEDDDDVHGLRNAAAAMVVGVGSMSDPPECQGLAHFLEHLLFMGSTKYPQENAYDEFMSKHGGDDNAYTEMEYTVYHFEIPQEQLAKALDMFAQFFTSPLMLESSVERELQAIESEFQLVKNSDSARVQHLMSHTCGHTPSEHPFATFSWGNLNSLKDEPKRKGVNPMAKLWEFYKQHYYGSNMRLVVTGAYTLDELQDLVVQSFSDVPSKGLPATWDMGPPSPLKSAGMPFTQACLGKVFYIAPVNDRHSLSVTWQVPSQLQQWKSKPSDYLAHLIGHEAKGSLLASLKSKSWATACCAGVGGEGYENASSHSLFIVSLTLSEEGVANWQHVVSELYQYVGMLRYHCEQGLPEWIYEELKSIQDVAYRYDDEQSPEEMVEDMADELAPFRPLPPDRLLDGTSLLFECDPDLVKTIADTYLKPENARIDLASTLLGRSADYDAVEPSAGEEPLPPSDEMFDASKAGAPRKEPIFGTYYWCQQLAASQLEQWTSLAKPQLPPQPSSLSLPPQNEFVPTRFALKSLPPSDSDHPLLNCSIKLQIPVGKKKQWFPATVTQYNSMTNTILLSYEDEDEKWHKMDVEPSTLTQSKLMANDFEGTLDNKKLKFRIVALASDGEGAVRKFGDESDLDVDDDNCFPGIPPATPPSRLPKLVCNTQVLKLFHLQDRNFRRPIAELRLQLNCGVANKTPLHTACADLLVHLVSDALTEAAYMASVCELGSSLSANECGFSLRVHGFDDKLLSLFSTIFEMLMSFRNLTDGKLPASIQEGRFELSLESYRRQCNNSGMKALKLSSGIRLRCLKANYWSAHQKLKAIEKIDIPLFVDTVSEILKKIGVEGIYHGNVDATDATKAQEEILRLLQSEGGSGLPRKKYPQQFIVQVPKASRTLHCPSKDPTDPNTALEVYFQVGKDNTKDRVLVDLLVELMYEPFYDQLRTKDQFGYQVSCDSRWTNGVIGMQFQVVTSSKTAQQAEDRVEKFILDYRKTLVDMTPDDFMQHMAGLAKEKLEMFNSLGEETGHYWSEIREGRYMWEVDRDEVLCLKNLTKKETLAAYDRWLSPKSKTRRRLAILVISSEGEASEGRPEVEMERVEEYNEGRISEFHKHCKNQTFGKIY